jgi:hypothetical protein
MREVVVGYVLRVPVHVLQREAVPLFLSYYPEVVLRFSLSIVVV